MPNKTNKTNGKIVAIALVALAVLGAVIVFSTNRAGDVTERSVQTPVINNINAKTSHILLKVNIPCTGHAQLISDGLKNISGVTGVQYTEPDKFMVEYDPTRTNAKDILSRDLFRDYPTEAQMSADISS